MRALAWSSLLAAWLWSSGIEVLRQPGFAAWLFAIGLVALWLGEQPGLRRSSILPTTANAALSGGMLLLAARAAQPAIDWIGPWLSFIDGPPSLLALIGRLFGLPAIAVGDGIGFANFHRFETHTVSLHQLGLPSFIALVAILAVTLPPRTIDAGKAFGRACLILVLWLPLRFLLVTQLVDSTGWIGAHWHPLAVAVSYLPALWLIELIARTRPSNLSLPPRRAIGLAALCLPATALVAFGLLAHPPGTPGGGRVLIDDMHSDWEWSDIEFNKTDYGRQTTYNYYSFRRYLERHFDRVDVNAERQIDAALLADYDVLILKTPTMPFLAAERDAIVEFVREGGGLALIGDHTNLFGMTTYLNPIAEPFGMLFRDDDTFDLTTGQSNSFVPPALGIHPAVAAMPGMSFETSCSIEPSLSIRPAMIGRALGSELVDYSHINFFGNIVIESDERWGTFIQAASTRFGSGRVFAFSDSTVFSNFSMFFRGKPELALGMVQFLDRSRGGADWIYPILPWLGVAGLGLWVWRSRRGKSNGPGLGAVGTIATLLLGVIGGATLASWHNRASGELPEPHAPIPYVVFDDSYSDFELPTMIEESSADVTRSFDSFFTAIQRLDLVPVVGESIDDAVERAQVIVLVDPRRAPDVPDLERLGAWVEAGGQLIVLEPSTGSHLAANGFLEPFGLTIAATFNDREGVPNLAINGGNSVERPEYERAAAPESELAAAVSAPTRLLPRGGDDVALAKSVSAEGTAPDTTEAPEAMAPPPPYELSSVSIGAGRVVALLGAERFSFRELGPAFNNPTPSQRRGYEATYWLFEEVLKTEASSRMTATSSSTPPKTVNERP